MSDRRDCSRPFWARNFSDGGKMFGWCGRSLWCMLNYSRRFRGKGKEGSFEY
jgi:hypothetical protein